MNRKSFGYKKFELKQEHLLLLQRLNLKHDDSAPYYNVFPTTDSKRPFGNSDAYIDAAKILQINAERVVGDDFEFDYNSEGAKYILELFHELVEALQIVLSTQTFTVGWYETDDYGGTWYRMDSE